MTSNNPDPNGNPGDFDWDRYEHEITDPDEQAGPVPVDRPEAQRAPRFSVAAARAGQRRPIVPRWLRSRRELADTAKWAAGYAAHTTGYHFTRSPKYAAKLAVRAPRGLLRTVSGFGRWLFDLEGEPVRQATVRTEDAETYLKLSRQRDRRVRWRGLVAMLLLITILVGTGAVMVAPLTVRWVLLGLAVVVFGALGAPADKPLLDTAVVTARVARLTSDVVVRALSVLSIAGINQALAKNPKAISFPAPITRDCPGWRADIDLPYGVTVGEVMDRRDKLASGLGRPLGCVWPEGNHDVSPSRLILWVGDHDMASARQQPWPLLKAGPVDLAKPFPFGTDPRGRLVHMELPYTNMLVGSIPGYGKTAALQLPLLVAGLDPYTEIWCYELKGTGGLDPLGKVATRYASGSNARNLWMNVGRRTLPTSPSPGIE